MFASFRRRLTGGYVLLALALIVVVVGTSSALAFALYARAVNDAVTFASQRASEEAARGDSPAQIVRDIGRGRFRVAITDSRHQVLAQSESASAPDARNRIAQALSLAIGLPRARAPIKGGTIVIAADFDRFGRILLWYWSIMLPVGALAVLAAWIAGRRITARAIGPLGDVTHALQGIAAGNFQPERLLRDPGELRELTAAYNEVVLRLSSATAERRAAETQMRQFIADAGHELRTPLTVIMGYLDVLRKDGIPDRQGAQRVYETMFEESRRMRGLIERLILLARLDRAPSAQKTSVDLRPLVDRAVGAVLPKTGQGRIQIDDRAHACVVSGDETEIYEAIKNVLDNAVKYAPDSPIAVDLCKRDEQVCVSVQDRGPGIEPQDMVHAFDRFYRGANKYDVEGSGLGLAIAKSAAERAGGSVELRSTAGAGTCVTLCFPQVIDIP